jgi:hypothetical protein
MMNTHTHTHTHVARVSYLIYPIYTTAACPYLKDVPLFFSFETVCFTY